jgi:murein L,D-transpeptidase YafK
MRHVTILILVGGGMASVTLLFLGVLATDPRPLPAGVRADHVVVSKHAHRLTLIANGNELRSYPIAIGWQPIGPKQFSGDGRTPEGVYLIDSRNRASRFHLALHISYPSRADDLQATRRGRSAGGDIMIHGTRPLAFSRRFAFLADWGQFIRLRLIGTRGCIAVRSAHMEEIWRAVAIGTPIEIDG